MIGCGGVGMAAINGAAIAGAGRIIAIDTNPAKLQLATKLGATDIVDPARGDVVQQVRELTGGGVHHSFEVLGRKETAEQSFAMLAAGGTATIVGMIPFGQKIELHGFDFLRERRIQGSSMGSNHFRVDMPRLVEFYMRGKLHLEDWISAKLKLSEINEGFANMKAGKTLRSVIMFDAERSSSPEQCRRNSVRRGHRPEACHGFGRAIGRARCMAGYEPGHDGTTELSSPRHVRRHRQPLAVLLRPAIGVAAVRLLAVGRGVAGRGVDDGEVAEDADLHVVGA